MRQVLLVHGINSNGKWQDDVSRVLDPHFQVVKVKYWKYRWLGGTKLLLEPWAFVLVGVVVYLLAAPHSSRWLAAVIALLFGLLVSYLLAPLRRNAARKIFVKKGDLGFGFGRPHIIAHSFGTYLTGSALMNVPAVQARRIVLVGCVLSDKFNWKKLKEKKPEAFDAVRNDWTNKDSVVRLASIIEWKIPDFGHAGLTGFDPDPGWVHSVGSPNLACNSCATDLDVPIHNFDCSGLGHSDSFLGRAHAARFWLPFLWGYSSKEYGELLDCCEAASDAFDHGDQHSVSISEDELLGTVWEWTHGEKLEAYFKELIETHPKRSGRAVSELLGRVTALFWTTIERGRQAAVLGNPAQQKWIVYLHPVTAASDAIDKVLSAP